MNKLCTHKPNNIVEDIVKSYNKSSICPSSNFVFAVEPTSVFNVFSSLLRSKAFDLLLVTLSLTSFNLASKSVFVIKLVISGILFSTAVNDELVARPLILGILPSTSVILQSKFVF